MSSQLRIAPNSTRTLEFRFEEALSEVKLILGTSETVISSGTVTGPSAFESNKIGSVGVSEDGKGLLQQVKNVPEGDYEITVVATLTDGTPEAEKIPRVFDLKVKPL